MNLINRLSLTHPLIQAPMAGVQDSKLAIAVCQAGGLGSLPCAMLSLDKIETEIHTIKGATDSPFNVNFFAHKQSEYTESMQQTWFEALQPYYDKFGLTKDNIATTGGRQPFGREQAELVADLKVPVVSFHFGLPEPSLLNIVKQAGAIVLSTATTVAEARWLEANGADMIIAQGLEAGGHRGHFLSQDVTLQMGTFSLLPNIVKAVNVPVIGAGGISDAITAKSAFALGASAVQVGTAFLLADECDTKDFHRQALQSEQAEHTALTNVFSGGLARGIVNRFMREMGYVSASAPPFPHASFVTNPIKAKAESMASDEFSSLWAGQNARLAKSGTAKDIIDRILDDK
ncbi:MULTISPECIES: NAD(P)H-dependent flavin oxidoreductase [unclassified Moraxella]|uniref:NAD(P)H-dependent flavin oxidoreductase n=1 Tax=unclassified Moraxella TaxID=2685852 RepID=UPI003AF4CC06